MCMRGVVGKQEFGIQKRGVELRTQEEWRTDEESENRGGKN